MSNIFRLRRRGIDLQIYSLGNTTYKSKMFASFAHKMFDIITATSINRIVIKEFIEYSHDVSTHLKKLEKDQILPLSYTIIGYWSEDEALIIEGEK